MYRYLYIMYERSRRKKRTRAGHAICAFSRTINSRRHYLYYRVTAIENQLLSVRRGKRESEISRRNNARTSRSIVYVNYRENARCKGLSGAV